MSLIFTVYFQCVFPAVPFIWTDWILHERRHYYTVCDIIFVWLNFRCWLLSILVIIWVVIVVCYWIFEFWRMTSAENQDELFKKRYVFSFKINIRNEKYGYLPMYRFYPEKKKQISITKNVSFFNVHIFYILSTYKKCLCFRVDWLIICVNVCNMFMYKY